MARKSRRAKTQAARPTDLPVRQKKAARVKGGDEILIAFQHGDVRSPVVVGNLWNSSDRPPSSKRS